MIHKLVVYIDDYCEEYEIGKQRSVYSVNGKEVKITPAAIFAPVGANTVEVAFEDDKGSILYNNMPYLVLKVNNE